MQYRTAIAAVQIGFADDYVHSVGSLVHKRKGNIEEIFGRLAVTELLLVGVGILTAGIGLIPSVAGLGDHHLGALVLDLDGSLVGNGIAEGNAVIVGSDDDFELIQRALLQGDGALVAVILIGGELARNHIVAFFDFLGMI